MGLPFIKWVIRKQRYSKIPKLIIKSSHKSESFIYVKNLEGYFSNGLATNPASPSRFKIKPQR